MRLQVYKALKLKGFAQHLVQRKLVGHSVCSEAEALWLGQVYGSQIDLCDGLYNPASYSLVYTASVVSTSQFVEH